MLEERIERYRDYIEADPYSWPGRWAEACAPAGGEAFHEVRLDLGCGKGSFTVEAARREPDVLFIGMDSEPICIAYAAQRGFESGLPNVIFVPGTGMRIREMFNPGELGVIYLNFPTPFPRKKDSKGRLVNLERLMDYRRVLCDGGEVWLRTDSQPLFDFALTQVPLAGYELTWQSRDARGERPRDPMSEYEERLGAQGALVNAYIAVPGPPPSNPVQTAEMSLSAYIPDDLSSFDTYAPHGMQGTIQNLRNRAAKDDGDWSRGITL
ncbi:tRNA (guanine(46)-N(7))-methyltransferase TrmB [Paratractidigestivibacter sp.]|uniref:tRNA (guanine(46)-N(7))-methyltransferase TrmB n=1 Tax=Paratractidigestivibacter sp. TaxID=2847316 RepID=UPI002ACB0DAA|nr:methyltransferase domain-containing protein [Paratractidigestivibacter sp.]